MWFPSLFDCLNALRMSNACGFNNTCIKKFNQNERIGGYKSETALFLNMKITAGSDDTTEIVLDSAEDKQETLDQEQLYIKYL